MESGLRNASVFHHPAEITHRQIVGMERLSVRLTEDETM